MQHCKVSSFAVFPLRSCSYIRERLQLQTICGVAVLECIEGILDDRLVDLSIEIAI